MSRVAVRQTPSVILTVELARAVVGGMKHEAASGLDRAAADDPDRLRARRKADRLAVGNDAQLHEQLAEIDLLGALVDDQPHRPVVAVGAQIDDRSGEGPSPQRRHGDEELAFQTGRRRRICPFHARLRGPSPT